MRGEDEATRLADQASVRAVIEKYMFALDRRDEAKLLEVFTEDADLSYHGGQMRMTGGAQFVEAGVRMVEQFNATSHNVHSFHATIDGDTAVADFIAIATLVDADKEQVVVRGIHYLDDLVRLSTGWCVRRRQHTPQWQYEVPTANVAFPQMSRMPETFRPT